MQCLKTQSFENRCQGEKIQKRSPPILVWMANPHTFQNDDAIAPPLDLLPPTSEPPRRLITTTTTTMTAYMLVIVPQMLLSLTWNLLAL